MKKFFALALSLVVASAGAQTYSKNSICMAYADLFSQAASYRDIGHPPTAALENSRYLFLNVPNPPISEQQIKNAINLVYFDPAFSTARGRPLRMVIWETCQNDWNDPSPKHQRLD